MKKEYHLTISRKDRIYLVVFVAVLLAWELIKLVLPFPKPMESEFASVSTGAMTQPDSVSLINKSSGLQNKFSPKENDEDDNATNLTPKERVPIPIMTASVNELVAIGFSKKVAYNIQKYISVGGQIRDEKNLKKIYGIDTNEIESLLPFIIFPAPKEKPDSSFLKSNYSRKEISIIALDLNQASADELESLPGIGAVLADRIIKFRTSLGGFSTKEQIKECYGLSPETFELIKPRITVEQPPQKFSINKIDPKTFSHPYLSKKIMWMLPNYIKNHGPIKNEEELNIVFPPDSNWCEKLLPYVRFE